MTWNLSKTVMSFAVAAMMLATSVPQISTPEPAVGSEWHIYDVASAGDCDTWTSLALDANDNPHIAYFDNTNDDLRYAKWNGNEWSIETVDTAISVGWGSTSLALDSIGYPHASYGDHTRKDLRYAKWNGTAWNIETVEVGGPKGFLFISLVLDRNDYAHISYHDKTNYDLKYAKWNGTAWNIETVDSAGSVGLWTSLALDSSEYPRVSYYDYDNAELKYAKWNGSAWNIEVVDSGGIVGWFTSLALDSEDDPHISYHELINLDLKYAKWNGSAWKIEVVDSYGSAGWYTSIALDSSDNPHVSYFVDSPIRNLRYAKWNGSAWNIETVDASSNAGWFASLALDSEDYPHISYLNATPDFDIKYATKSELGPVLENEPPVADAGPDQTVYVGDVVQFDGSGSYDPDAGWQTSTVDSDGDVGLFTSIDIDSNDTPHISYYDNTDFNLKYAKWTGSNWSIETVDSNGTVGYWTSLAIDSNDNPHIGYQDRGPWNLKYAKWNGSTWNIETADSNIDVGGHISIALDNSDHAHIGYRDYYNCDLKYAKWTGSNWSIGIVDSAGDVGWYISIELDSNDNPHISYYDASNSDLKYARWNGTSWNIKTVDSAGSVGGDTSIALDSNDNPHISYLDSTNEDLKYAKWTGSNWSIETVDSAGGVGFDTSIALDSNDNPHISYGACPELTNCSLKYAKPTGSGWDIETVDVDNVGWTKSIALDSSDFPHISHWDYDNQDLMYSKKVGGIITYDWDFGDGSPHGTGVRPTHIYSNPGIYNVTLTVTDTQGAKGTDNCIITVLQSDQPPVADAGPDQTVSEGDTVQFDGTGSYDPASRERVWVSKSNIPTPRLAVAGAVLNDGLYVIGGGEWLGYWDLVSVVEKYDPKTDSWYNETPIFEPHSYMGVGVVKGKLYAMGGFAGNQSQTTNLEFNPNTHTWVNKTPMPSPRHNFAVAVVNDKIYAMGGTEYGWPWTILSLVEEYDPATDTWTRKEDMPTGRTGLAAAVCDSKIYAIGGHNYSYDVDKNFTIVEVYDPATDTWTSASPLLTGRSDLRAETLGGKIYAIGGWEPGVIYPEAAPASNITEVYDPTTDTWASVEAMWETRAKFVSGVIDGRIYVVAGHSAGWWAPFPDWSEEYGPTGELQYAWDFDVNVDSDGDGNYTNDVDATGPTPTHIYYDDGVYIVTLKVTDAGGLSDWDTCNITVLNVAPTPEWTSRSFDGTIINPPYPEGKEIIFEATVSDPGIYDTFTYDWDFGDSTILLDAGPSITHTYGDDDVYIVVLTVTDDDGGVGIDDTPPLETTNENPIASIIMPYCIFTEGTSPCEAIGAFTDPGWLDTHSAVWDYGDGTYETAVLTEENDPPDATGWNITSHIYGDDGVYNITFTVVDDDGGVGIAWAEAQVMNLPPSVDMTAPLSVNEGEDFVLAITVTDPGSDDIIISVDWGDGTSETETHYNNGIGPDPPNSGEGVYPFTAHANLTHTYGDNGNFTIQVTVEDDDGGSAQDSAAIEVLNLPPEINLLAVPTYVNEGDEFSLIAEASDPGSDDIQFIWTFELGPSMSTIYYNDGVGPDPPLSPWGIFPFVAEDTVNHSYGDNGYYNVTVTATDDDGGMSISSFTIEVVNVEPSIDIGGPYAGDENSPIEFTATATDPGSDDLTLLWDWGDGTTDAIAFYNNGVSSDPPKSPWGTYPFEATHTTSHLWGDNGDFTVTLTVMDDDGAATVEQTVVTVSNVAPTIESIVYYLNASFSFRIAGEKWHNVEIHLYEDGTEIGYANITRYPGSPNDQMVTLADISIDFSKTYSAVAYYTPEDDPINGQIWGATPAWMILEDGEERIHHTFNVRHEDTWTWVIDDLSPYFLGHNITFMATASDPGSDDLTFTWDWGDGNTTENVYYNDGIGPDPYPSPEVNPITVTDTVEHSYASAGTHTITLLVMDDDGGITSYSLNLTL